MGFKYSVRPAGSGDWGTVLKMIEELVGGTGVPDYLPVKYNEKEFQTYCSGDHAFIRCIVVEAVDDEETHISEKPFVVGFALYYYTFSSTAGKMVYLEDLYLREGHRGNGLGRTLMSAVAKIGANNGCKAMQWVVLTSMEAARGFYERLKAVDKTEKEGWRINRLDGESFAKLANVTE